MTTGKKVLLGLLVALGLVGALILALFMEQQADQAERKTPKPTTPNPLPG